MKKICVLGEGAWGTAIATLLAHNGYQINLWCYDATNAEIIKTTHHNQRYMPTISLDQKIIPFTSLQEAIADVFCIFEAIPVQFLRSLVMKIKSFDTKTPWIILSKGIEQETSLLPSQLINEVMENTVAQAALLGPSYAYDVVHKHKTAVTLATSDQTFGKQLQKIIDNDYFKTYASSDIIGAQISAACKNMIALAIGMLDGAGYGDTIKAFVATQGLQEMALFAQAYGGKQETIYGLSGVGDMILTAFGKQSKNQEVGRRLAQGKSLEIILQETKFIPESINTLQSIPLIYQKYKITLPFFKTLYSVVFHHDSIESMVNKLMK